MSKLFSVLPTFAKIAPLIVVRINVDDPHVYMFVTIYQDDTELLMVSLKAMYTDNEEDILQFNASINNTVKDLLNKSAEEYAKMLIKKDEENTDV